MHFKFLYLDNQTNLSHSNAGTNLELGTPNLKFTDLIWNNNTYYWFHLWCCMFWMSLVLVCTRIWGHWVKRKRPSLFSTAPGRRLTNLGNPLIEPGTKQEWLRPTPMTAQGCVVCCCKLNNTGDCDEHLFGQVRTRTGCYQLPIFRCTNVHPPAVVAERSKALSQIQVERMP